MGNKEIWGRAVGILGVAAVVVAALINVRGGERAAEELRMTATAQVEARDTDISIAIQKTLEANVTATPLHSSIQTDTPPPTDTPTITSTPTPIPPTPTVTDTGTPTDTPLPTNTPTLAPTNTPTRTPIPTATPIPSTEPGTILENEGVWREDDWDLTLDAMIRSSSEIGLTFFLTSNKRQEVPVSYDLGGAVRATDNFGNRLDLVSGHGLAIRPWSHVIKPGETVMLRCYGNSSNPPSIAVVGDFGNVRLTEVIVTLNISTIENASWRIEIPH